MPNYIVKEEDYQYLIYYMVCGKRKSRMGNQICYKSYKQKEEIQQLWLSSFMIHEYIITRDYNLALILAIELYNEALIIIQEHRDSSKIADKYLDLMSDLIDEIIFYIESTECCMND